MRVGFAVAALVLALSSELPAQVIMAPPPGIVIGPVVLAPGGIVKHHRRHPFSYGPGYTIVGPYGIGPAGVVDNRISIKIIPPPVILVPAPVVDLRGVDLDVVGPEAIQPGGKSDLAKIPAPPPPNKLIPKPVEAAKPVEVPAKPPVIVEIPKKEVPPPPKPVPPKPVPPMPEKPAGLQEPRAEPLEESRRLTDLGLAAFGAREYGLAALRFRQAADVKPDQPRPYFLLAQANLALGKYKDAVAAIENGMRRQEDWPLSAFQPRVDLYKGIEDDWFAHKKQLTDVQALHPQQSIYLFLQAYQWWFDGQRDQAAEMFARARALAPGNAFIEAFLKVNPKLAAN